MVRQGESVQDPGAPGSNPMDVDNDQLQGLGMPDPFPREGTPPIGQQPGVNRQDAQGVTPQQPQGGWQPGPTPDHVTQGNGQVPSMKRSDFEAGYGQRMTGATNIGEEYEQNKRKQQTEHIWQSSEENDPQEHVADPYAHLRHHGYVQRQQQQKLQRSLQAPGSNPMDVDNNQPQGLGVPDPFPREGTPPIGQQPGVNRQDAQSVTPQQPQGGWQPGWQTTSRKEMASVPSMKRSDFEAGYGQRMTGAMNFGEEYEWNKRKQQTDHIWPSSEENDPQEHVADTYARPLHHRYVQIQQQQKLQRSLQASKQMAYDVFANVITAIEELEQREAKKYKKLPAPERSEAFIPDQSFKTYEDVVASAEGQLIVFQAHMGYCPKEVADQVKIEMIDTFLTWGAARHDLNMPVTKVDECALNMLEILYSGATQQTFSVLKENWKPLSRSELMDSFRKIMAGQHKADKLDQQFADNPAKKAEALPIRQGRNIADGIMRYCDLAKKKKKAELMQHLQRHYEAMGGTR